MKKSVIVITILLLAAAVWFVWMQPKGNPSDKTTLHVLAAASLEDAMKEMKQQYEKEHPSIELEIHYASSGKLQHQIEQGVQADLFLSAGDEQMKALDTKDLIDKETNLLENRLVLITQQNQSAITDVNDLESSQVKKISIGHPDTVPAGAYAKQTLRSLEEWQRLKSKLVYASDVTQVLSHVQTGNADAGFVYQTDADKTDNVQIIKTISREHHDSIDYPMGIVKETENLQATQDLFQWLQDKEAKDIFRSYDFEMSE